MRLTLTTTLALLFATLAPAASITGGPDAVPFTPSFEVLTDGRAVFHYGSFFDVFATLGIAWSGPTSSHDTMPWMMDPTGVGLTTGPLAGPQGQTSGFFDITFGIATQIPGAPDFRTLTPMDLHLNQSIGNVSEMQNSFFDIFTAVQFNPQPEPPLPVFMVVTVNGMSGLGNLSVNGNGALVLDPPFGPFDTNGPAPEIRLQAGPSVPEPATLFLLGSGLLGTGFARRRRS